MSPNHPNTYGSSSACIVSLSAPSTVDTIYFQTEASRDIVTIMGKQYSGEESPGTFFLDGTISWRADESYQLSGWKFCTEQDNAWNVAWSTLQTRDGGVFYFSDTSGICFQLIVGSSGTIRQNVDGSYACSSKSYALASSSVYDVGTYDASNVGSSGAARRYTNGAYSAACSGLPSSKRRASVVLSVDNNDLSTPSFTASEPSTCEYLLVISASQAYFGITVPPSPPPVTYASSLTSPPSPSPPPPGAFGSYADSNPPPPSPSPPPPMPPEDVSGLMIIPTFFPILVVLFIIIPIYQFRARQARAAAAARRASNASSISLSSVSADSPPLPSAVAAPMPVAVGTPVATIAAAATATTTNVNVTVDVQQQQQQQPPPQYDSVARPLPVDTTGDGVRDSLVIDTNGDGRPDLVVPNPNFRPSQSPGVAGSSLMAGTPVVVPGVAVPVEEQQPRLVEVTVPNGVYAGETFTAQMPDGQLANCQVPQGEGPGSTIRVQAPPPTVVVAAEVVPVDGAHHWESRV